MTEWRELPSKVGQFWEADVAGDLGDALPVALASILEKLAEYHWAIQGHVTVMLEASIDTGRLTAAVVADNGQGAATRRDGCSIRLQSLQDFWYDTDETAADAAVFDAAVEAMRHSISQAFVAVLQREGRIAMPDADSLRFVMTGAEPGEVLGEYQIF